MRLAGAPELSVVEGPTLALPPALLRGDARLTALFEPFGACVVLHEALLHEGASARASRLLMAEIRGDRFDDVRAIVRAVCPNGAFEEKPTELDDVAAGSEWRERSGSLAVSAYRLFGGSTSLHVKEAKVAAPDAGMLALRDSPLAFLEELVTATSFVEHLSATRNANDSPRWHLHARLRDLRRFEEIAPRVAELGFEGRRAGKHWRENVILQPVGKDRWMAAVPGIEL